MPIPRVDVLGVGVSVVDMETTLEEIGRWIADRERHYVCVTGVHGVMESQTDHGLLDIHNQSGLTIPDGAPMLWAGRFAGAEAMGRVRGPDLFPALCERAAHRGWTSYLYGGAPGTAELLADRLQGRFPQLKIVGWHTPPYREMTAEEDRDVVDQINACAPDVVWVGLSTPKQERWMASHVQRLHASALLGVGGAFDVHAGLAEQAPPWLQRSGFEWAYRLSRDPRRLWRRYLRNNPRFVAEVLRRRPYLRADANERSVTKPRQ